MCGRFTLTVDKIDFILQRFKAELAPNFEGYKPRFNAAPGQFVPTIVSKEDGNPYLMNMFWGFVPPWGESTDGSTTSQANIRDDTIKKNKFFYNRLLTNRCIFVVDGFYEWQKPIGYENLKRGEQLPRGVRKTPHRILMKSKEVFPLAGLWRSIQSKENTIVTAGIITTSPNKMMEKIHNRMPVILNDNEVNTWLDPSVQDFEQLHELLKPYPDKEMDSYIVSNAVNSSKLDSSVCIQPAV
jgi:putative SOS response-associated peptidase YedK